VSDTAHKTEALNTPSNAPGLRQEVTSAPLIEPAPCVIPIRDLWRRSGPMGLNRAIANVVVQRLRPTLADRMDWPLETAAMGTRQLCFIYPTIPPQGHWFTLAPGSCNDIVAAAQEQIAHPPQRRADVLLFAVWRPQRAGADRRVHTWAIPAQIVALMSKRLDGPEVSNRNVGIEPPAAGRPSVWRKGRDDADPIPLQEFYKCWTLSDAELAYVQEAETNEIRQPRVSRRQT
jgi:hypothetical protein